MKKIEQKYLDDLVILIDTREQTPWEFARRSCVETLAVGDYSIADRFGQGFKPGVCEPFFAVSIERKRLDDLVSCLGYDRDRFERELVRGAELGYFALIVEAGLDDIASHKYQSRMTARSVIQSLTAFSVRYRLPIFFADNARYAARLAESLLVKWVRELIKTEKLKAQAAA